MIRAMWKHMLASCVTLACAAPAPASAWSRDGHRAVCLIAWEQVNETARSRVFDLLDISTEGQFADSCVWADEIMGTRPETAAWHTVLLPKNERAFDLTRDCARPESCVIREVERFAQVLKGAAPKAEKAEALKFLSHLVGDLHQPLNIGFTDHRNGRQISGMFHGFPSNLHAVWDHGLLSTLVPAGKDAAPIIFDAAAWTGRLYGADKKTPLSWANETLWITISPPTGYLGNEGADVFGEHYIRQNRSVALEQIDKAGVRLADLLNEALK